MSRPKPKIVIEAEALIQKQGCISTSDIIDLGWTGQPAAFINRLRQSGVGLQLQTRGNKQNGNVSVWKYCEFDDTPAGDKHGEGPDLEIHEMTCKSCGHSFTVQVWPGDRLPARRFCYTCIKSMDNYAGTLPKNLVKTPHRTEDVSYRRNEAVIYRPGDPGFNEIAKQCSPPGDINANQ